MVFSIVFWNVWYLNQVEDSEGRERLLSELKKMTDQHRPDVIALAEVVSPSKNITPSVVEYLSKLGYNHRHCANMAQLDNYWMSGVTLCSRFPLSQKQNVVISKNGYAAKVGYPNLDKELISARIALPEGRDFKIIVAHPSATVDSLTQHRIGINTLDRLVHSKDQAKNTILVGDMNQWRLIPRAFRSSVADVMHSRTGSALNPTWRYNANRFTPLRLNLDYVYWSKQSNFYLRDFQVLPSKISDHRPLLAIFEYLP